MHPDNIYSKHPPNYKKLAKKHKAFATHVTINKKGYASIDYKNPSALLSLTKVLLKNDFGLQFDMPLNHLCPPVPQRLNYILWVNDLLKEFKINSKVVFGLDIGTGCSCILPLLGYSKFKWHFVATDIGEESLKWAGKNIQDNNLQNFIQTKKVNPIDPIFACILDQNSAFDFVVCNPPFFSSLKQTGLNKRRGTLGTKDELVCPGGEVSFINKMVEESKMHRTKVGWFTSMVGKKSTLKTIISRLKLLPNCHIRKTRFVQGKQSRWGIAWRFGRNDLVRSSTSSFIKSFRKMGKDRFSVFCKLDRGVANLYGEVVTTKSLGGKVIAMLVGKGLNYSVTENGEIIKTSKGKLELTISINGTDSVGFNLNIKSDVVASADSFKEFCQGFFDEL